MIEQKRSWLMRLARALVAVSFPLYGGMLVVPFSSFHSQTKGWLWVGLFIAAEITFWVGAVILGKEVMARYRRFFSPRRWLARQVQSSDTHFLSSGSQREEAS